jgi:hypothetical protein
MMNKKNIIFINMEPPYKLQADTLLLAAPYTTASVQQVLVYDTELHVRDLSKNKQEDADQYETTLELCRESFDKLYDEAHTVVIPDALFSERSRIFKTSAFLENGMPALRQYYKNGGGRVIVICMEGVSNATENINALFDTDWKLQYFEKTTTVVPTDFARSLFGQFVPRQYNVKGMPYFISCAPGEGLFQQLMNDKETFVEDFHAEDEAFERLGIEKDESLDCFNVEKSWTQYVKKYTDRYCIALHVDDEKEGAGGQVVWFGDRGQSDGLAFIFCKLFILDQLIEKHHHQQHQRSAPVKSASAQSRGDGDDDDMALLFTRKGPSTTLLISILVVLLALVTRYFLGLQQQ